LDCIFDDQKNRRENIFRAIRAFSIRKETGEK